MRILAGLYDLACLFMVFTFRRKETMTAIEGVMMQGMPKHRAFQCSRHRPCHVAETLPDELGPKEVPE